MAGWTRGVLKSIERLLVVAAAVCLAWVYATWKQAEFYQVYAKRELAQMLATAQPLGEAERPPAVDLAARDDSLIAMLEIPRLGVSVAVLEGDDDLTLRLGVGHLPGTPLPWDDGNTAVAGHRDTFFRPLKDLRVGDEIQLATRHGAFRYRVRQFLVVGPNDLWVLDPTEQARLTLITCYPFTYLGPAPDRFVVQAERDMGGTALAVVQ